MSFFDYHLPYWIILIATTVIFCYNRRDLGAVMWPLIFGGTAVLAFYWTIIYWLIYGLAYLIIG